MSIPTIIATPGAVNANSFGTRTEADAYHSTVLHSDAPWPALIAASVIIGSGDNGKVTITVDEPGSNGNSFTIVVNAGVGISQPMTAAILGSAITVTLGTNGAGAADPAKNTAILVAGAINALAGVTAVASGTGATTIPVTAIKSFTGGDDREDIKNPALIMAQQQMTALIEWTGNVTSYAQKLPWPRTGMIDRYGSSILETVIPDEVKWAQFELARLLALEDRTIENDIALDGITHLRAGPVTLKFRESTTVGSPVLAPVVWNLLVPSWYEAITGMPSMNIELERA